RMSSDGAQHSGTRHPLGSRQVLTEATGCYFIVEQPLMSGTKKTDEGIGPIRASEGSVRFNLLNGCPIRPIRTDLKLSEHKLDADTSVGIPTASIRLEADARNQTDIHAGERVYEFR